jgi:hypothetical protein
MSLTTYEEGRSTPRAWLRFVLCIEPARRRTTRINPGEFTFQLLTDAVEKSAFMVVLALSLLLR